MSELSRATKEKYAQECAGRIVSLFPYKVEITVTTKTDDNNEATCHPENQYFRARVNVNLDNEANDTKKGIAQNVFHECQHILVYPLDQYACRLAKATRDKTHKRQLEETMEFVVSSMQLAYFGLVFPEFAD